MSWGLWAMATSDGLEYISGIQPSAVHMGTWYAGDLLDISDWPTWIELFLYQWNGHDEYVCSY